LSRAWRERQERVMTEQERQSDNDFAAQAASGDRSSLLREFVEYFGQNKKWWLAPIIASILLLGALVLLGGTAAAPFIYTLF
jgi:hypothetical protein